MKSLSFVRLALSLGVLSTIALPAPRALAAASLEVYGTFHSMGVIITLSGGEDPNQNATASLSYRLSGVGAYQPAFPLTRVNATRFAGSLFWLTPGTAYDVRVTFSDPDGGALNGTTLNGTGTTRAELSLPAPTSTYIVSAAGSGTACTLAAPCALSTALNAAQPGASIELRGGTYAQGGLATPRSGSAGAPIVIRSYAGERAVFDGADPATFTWTAQGGGVYRATVNVADTHLVSANNQRLYPYASLADLQNLVWGIPGFYVSGTAVYVRLAGDANPTGQTLRVSRFNTAFTINDQHIAFVDLTFQNYGQGSYAKAIYFDTASDNLVQGSTFFNNDLGIGFKRESGRNVIQDNEFSDTNFMWPWDAVKGGSDLETGGVGFYSPTTGRGNVIRRNVFHDYFDGATTCPEDNGASTNETDFYENEIYNAGDDALSADGACSNVRIWGNVIHNALVGISFAPIYEGPIYAIRNVIYNLDAGNNNYSGMSFKFNSGYSQSGRMYLFHNTVDAVRPDNPGFDIRSPGTWQLIIARNNIWAGTGYAIENANTSQPLDFDYDNLYTSGPELAWWGGAHYATLAAFRSGTGLEAHGVSLPAGFTDAAGGDYSLAAGSGMIDKGLAIPGINDGYAGAAPDLGAHEFTPGLTASAVGGDGALTLTWAPTGALPGNATWRITYTGPAAAPPSPVAGLANGARSQTFTGATNYALYTFTVEALVDGSPILSASASAMPTDRALYLPLVRR
ncbi:MAG: right-handed parallel beta-helix repeat-containing protein [Anaerolineales bacterium]|nr:right-handed parallel beta-helix repeat-containing protein [Anaerolineales bacterium]